MSKKGSLGAGPIVSQLRDLPPFEMAKLKIRTLSRARQTPGVSVLHVVLPPKYDHVPVFHRFTREWLIILSGAGKGVIGGRLVRFKPGTIVYMPPGMPHQMSTGSSSLEVLVLFSPPLNIRSKKADICHAPCS